MPRTIQGWQSYGSESSLPISLTSEATSAGNRLDKFSSSHLSSSVDLRFLDLGEDGPIAKVGQEEVASENNVGQAVVAPIFIDLASSLHSYQSPQPIEITASLLRKIFKFHDVDLDFLDVLFSFGRSPNQTESGASNWTSKAEGNGSRKLSYQLKYVEPNPLPGKHTFSPRQTGIYHHSCKAEGFDLLILLHPREETLLEQQILKMVQDKQAAKKLVDYPMRVHLLAYELYIGNWRWYLRDLGEELDRKVPTESHPRYTASLPLTSPQNDKIMIVDLDTPAAVSLNLEKVQALRNLGDKTLTLNGHCTSAKTVLEKLKVIPNNGFTDGWDAEPYVNRLAGYIDCIPALTSRVQNSIELHAYALDLKNQFTAADINQQVENIAEDTKRDTTSVKWITYLTLIYLPWSFTATLYGMNVFWFNQSTRRLAVSQDIWIWVATAVPLTVLTIGCYRVMNTYIKAKPHNDKLFAQANVEKSMSGP
ncbi:uncharacterized protein KY384_004806 [Bacidia gigantensis]|uniref:uncharacterized protein n=1 Tax=Bacidia gigantensis TaxID=2732470 RepID=UPI001D053CCF|nr:uncharacterized protein KY384_004806 [Bacidia gigantensis]KAG8530304.1 hypothetical protein KY384_004806 [Bacidia gigantensis]